MKVTNPRFLNPYILNNFLIAKSYNKDKSIKMFEDYMKFRQEMKVDKLIEEDWSRIGVFKSLYPRAFFHTDKEGRPVLIEKIGKAKFGRIFKEFDMEFIKRMLVLNYEILERMILPECSKKAGKPITQMTVILDVKGVSVTDLMSKNVYNLVTYSSKLIQDYYPEIVYKTLIINTPMMFSAFFKVIKPVLNSRTQASMSLSGSGYKKEIENIISMENLPAEYGGTNKDHFDGKDYGFYSQVPNLPFSLKKWEVTEEDLKGPVINFPALQTPVDIPMDNEENGQNEEQIEEDPNFDPNTLLDQNGEMQETIEENGEGDLQAEIAVDAGLTTPVMPLPPS